MPQLHLVCSTSRAPAARRVSCCRPAPRHRARPCPRYRPTDVDRCPPPHPGQSRRRCPRVSRPTAHRQRPCARPRPRNLRRDAAPKKTPAANPHRFPTAPPSRGHAGQRRSAPTRRCVTDPPQTHSDQPVSAANPAATRGRRPPHRAESHHRDPRLHRRSGDLTRTRTPTGHRRHPSSHRRPSTSRPAAPQPSGEFESPHTPWPRRQRQHQRWPASPPVPPLTRPRPDRTPSTTPHAPTRTGHHRQAAPAPAPAPADPQPADQQLQRLGNSTPPVSSPRCA